MASPKAIIAFVRQANGQVTPIVTNTIQSAGTGINTAGTVIVNINPDYLADIPTCATFDAVSGLRDLNTLIPATSGWHLRTASGINDKGLIIGSGQFQGSQHGYLLTPVASGT